MMSVLRFILQTTYPYRFYLYGMVFSIFVVAVDANVKPYLIKMLIDTVTGVEKTDLFYLVLIYVVFQTLMISAWSASDWCAIRYTFHFRSHILLTLTERLNRYTYDFFQNNLSGSLLAKIRDAFNLIPSLIFTAIYQFIHCTLLILITLIFLAKVHIFFALGLLAWIMLFLLSLYVGLMKVRPLISAYAESTSQIWGNRADFLTNILNVKSFANNDYEMSRLKGVSKDFIAKAQRQGYFLMNFYIIGGIIVSIYTLSFLILLIYLHSYQLITAGDFALFLISFVILSSTGEP